MKTKIVLVFFILVCCIRPVEARTFKIASYNVENLFDLINCGTEYTEYIPNTGYGWDKSIFQIKVDNIAEVIKDMRADVVALQEIESQNALEFLRDRLKALNDDYPYYEMAKAKDTVVKCALLSKFHIVEKDEIQVDNESGRNILKIMLDIDGRHLTLFVNHWKSKRGPESMRMPYAGALKKEIDKLEDEADFILIGDFNSDYNEWQTFRDSLRLNDTDGKTGINHVLKTVMASQLVEESTLVKQTGNEYLYNLWLEVDSRRRWSHNFFGSKNSLDNIIVSRGLYDGRGVSYVDNSFDRFDPDYLFREKAVYRWQRAKGGKGKHLGEGYSDHLPVFASFSTEPFHFVTSRTYAKEISESTLEKKRISEFYTSRIGNVNYLLQSCVVIYKHEDDAIIKQENGRAIFVYKAGQGLEYGNVYDLNVKEIYDYYGLREITTIGDIRKTGHVDNPGFHLFQSTSADFSDPDLQNEVISEVEGVYKWGYFFYGDGKKIKLYFTKNALRPQNNSKVLLKGVRIGYHKYPQIIIEKAGQIE